MVLCISCKNEPLEVIRNNNSIYVNLITTQVLSDFTPYAPTDMDMYESDGITSTIRIEAFIYDDSGRLIGKHTDNINSYNHENLSIALPIAGSNPTLICFSYAVWTNAANEEFRAYEISGEELLSTLMVENTYAHDGFSIPWQVLGFFQTSISTEENINVILKPIGALVYLDWTNIHSNTSIPYEQQRYTLAFKDNDILKCNDLKWVYSSSLSGTWYHIAYCYPKLLDPSKYNGMYDFRFFLPGNSEAFGFWTTSPSEFINPDDETGRTDTSTESIEIKTGRQYVIKMNCTDFSLEYYEGLLD